MSVKNLLNQLNTFEAPLCRVANQGARHLETERFFIGISRLGDGIFWYLVMLLLPILYGRPGLVVALQMLMVGFVSLLIYKGLKHLTGRPRPCEAFPDIRRHAPMLDRYSFPSGHSMHAVGFSGVVLVHFPVLGIPLAGFAVLVAYSRLILGLHYPSDVIAGAMIGSAVAWASFHLMA